MRRLIDTLVGVAALVILSPVFIAIAVWILFDSPGNPFYRALRIGQGGRPFRMWKFRTMTPSENGPAITGQCDPRITRSGAFLRRSKLDELPQFINLITGEMTLVGPRPEAPALVARYDEWQREVLDAKPGITGPVQIESGEESDAIPLGVSPEDYYVEYLMDSKLSVDLVYQRTRTPLSDAKIVFATAGFFLKALWLGIFPSATAGENAKLEATPVASVKTPDESFSHRSLPE